MFRARACKLTQLKGCFANVLLIPSAVVEMVEDFSLE